MTFYRVNGVDAAISRFVTVPHETESVNAAIEWARRYTIFKPFSNNMLLRHLQFWDGEQWRWVNRGI